MLFDALPLASLDQLVPFCLMLARISGLFLAIPLFGAKIVPARVKAPLILAMALLLFPVVKPQPLPAALDSISVALLVIGETLIGLTLGVISQLVFAAVEFCGHLVATQIGLSMSSLLDPGTQSNIPTVAMFQGALATLIFLALDVHHVFISGFVESYRLIPVGNWHVSGPLLKLLVETSSGMLVIAMKLAAPVAVALLATTVVVGISARVFPQMNVFMVSMPLSIGVGFLILGLSLPVFVRVLQGAFGAIPQQMRALFKLLA